MSIPGDSLKISFPGGLAAELVATGIQMRYDPTTQKAGVVFTGQPFIAAGGTYIPIGSGSMDILEVELETIMAECICEGNDPVTGADLSKISGLGILIFMKQAYKVLHQRRADAVQAAINAGEALPGDVSQMFNFDFDVTPQ